MQIEGVEFKSMTLHLRVNSHARATAYAKACGMTKRQWLLAAINAGLRADPSLKGPQS